MITIIDIIIGTYFGAILALVTYKRIIEGWIKDNDGI